MPSKIGGKTYIWFRFWYSIVPFWRISTMYYRATPGITWPARQSVQSHLQNNRGGLCELRYQMGTWSSMQLKQRHFKLSLVFVWWLTTTRQIHWRYLAHLVVHPTWINGRSDGTKPTKGVFFMIQALCALISHNLISQVYIQYVAPTWLDTASFNGFLEPLP